MNKSNKPDILVSTELNLAIAVEIHETYSNGKDMMVMRQVEFFAIIQKSTVQFQPRGLHVMLLRLSKNLKIGNTGEILLFFKNTSKLKVKGVIRDMS